MPFIIDARNMGGGSIGSAAGGDTSTGTRNNVTLAAPWDESKEYLKGDLATNNGDLYQAQKSVPAGVKISDEDYWALVVAGDKSKETEQLRKDIGSLGDLETESKDNLVAAINEAARSGGAGAYYVDIALTSMTAGTPNRTFAEMKAAYEAGMTLYVRMDIGGETAMLPMVSIRLDQCYFEGTVHYDGAKQFILIRVKDGYADATFTRLATFRDLDNAVFRDDIVTALSSSSTDSEVPSAKCVYDELQERSLKQATSDTLGGIKADPATADDIQPVRIGTDGKLVTAPAAVSDAQVSSAVSTWLTEHPEATTTVKDGAVTDAKLSDDLYKQVMGDERHKLTEVKIDLHYIKYSAWEEQPSAGGMRATNIFPTPQYIKIVSHTSDFSVSETIKINAIRFLADEEGTADSSGLERNIYFLRDEVPNDETVIMPTFEYDRVGAGYMQLRFVLTNWQKPMGLFDVYAIYDTWRPTYTLPDDTGEFVYDLPVKYLYNGENNSTYVKLWGIVPYYPGTTYNIRGGYYANSLIKELNVAYLLDDSIFTTWDDGILIGSSNKATLGAIPLYRGIRTTQYDTSVNGGANAAYQWAYVTTPPESELIGPKWVAIVMGDHIQDEKGDKGTEYYSALLAAIEAKGVQNMYITRFNKQVPRSLYAQLAFPNPNYHDDGSKYYAMLTSASKSPLVGAKWTLFGDSLTDNYGGHDLTGSYFATKIAREFNMSFDNRAKSGSNIYRGGSGNYVSVSGMIKLDEFIAEIEAGTTEQPDYITIAFGTNSFAAQIGTDEDTSMTDTSVYGATKRFIEVLRAKCPKSVFGFVLPPKQNWGGADPSKTRAVDAARTAIKTVCDSYGVPYIDMSTQSGITVDMLPDGIHISNDQSQNLYYHAMRRFMIGL